MSNFVLELHNKSDNEIKEAKELRREHHTIYVFNLTPDTLNVIRQHNLHTLNFWDTTKKLKLSTLIGVLNYLPSLKSLNLNCTCDVSGSSDLKKVRLSLKKLLHCPAEALHVFDCSSLEELAILWGNFVDNDNKMLAIDFLNRQKNLQSLIINSMGTNDFFNSLQHFEQKYFLKKFYHYQSVPLPKYEKFIKFLELHKKTLTHLELDFCTEPHFGIDQIHKFVMEDLLNLKHLRLGYVEIYDEEELSFDEIRSATQVIENLESLRLFEEDHLLLNEKCYMMFPNLKHLTIEKYSPDGNEEFAKDFMKFLLQISEKCVNLVTLHIDRMLKSDDLYFPKLEKFHVAKCEEIDFCSFINRHSKTLENISFENKKDLTELTFKELINCDKLRYVEFSASCLPVMKIFHQFSLRSKPFTFRLWCKLKAEDTNENKIQFNFPDDKAYWDEIIASLEMDSPENKTLIKLEDNIFC